MESTKEREDGGISELIQARQEALNMLLVARLEGQSNRVVADAVRRGVGALKAGLRSNQDLWCEQVQAQARVPRARPESLPRFSLDPSPDFRGPTSAGPPPRPTGGTPPTFAGERKRVIWDHRPGT